jgi:ankyrin repeat protein
MMNDLRTSTPLHVALINGQLELARTFIEQGVLINDQDENGETALFLAIEFENISELLLKAGADVNISNNLGETPLHKVAANGTANQVNLLLNSGASIEIQNHLNQSPLHYAAAHGNHEIVKLLIERAAKINTCDIEGKTSLHHAVYGNIMSHELNKYRLTAEILIRAGADLQAQTNQGETPLNLAKRHFGYPELAALLIQHGAE